MPARFELATFCVWGRRDNHYTTGPCYITRFTEGNNALVLYINNTALYFLYITVICWHTFHCFNTNYFHVCFMKTIDTNHFLLIRKAEFGEPRNTWTWLLKVSDPPHVLHPTCPSPAPHVSHPTCYTPRVTHHVFHTIFGWHLSA